MKRNPFLLPALMLLPLYLVVQIGTLDLGHELTYFGSLSPLQSACVRYALLIIPACLFAIAALRRPQ